MLLEELDGLIAGLLVCPDLIKPGEWLPIIWNRDSAEPQPAFQDLDHVNRVLGLVMEQYNSVARTLMERPDRYSAADSTKRRHCGAHRRVTESLTGAIETDSSQKRGLTP
jgi:uncharacterized protein